MYGKEKPRKGHRGENQREPRKTSRKKYRRYKTIRYRGECQRE